MNTRLKGVLGLIDLQPLAVVLPMVMLAVNVMGQTNCAPPPSGLVSWWRAETNAFDAVDGNHGTTAGQTGYGLGRVGAAFIFDGNADGVSVGTSANLQLQNFTIEGWVRRFHPTLASLGSDQSGAIFAWTFGGYALAMWDDGRLFISQVGSSHTSSTLAITDTTNYHHVAVTKVGPT